MRKLQVGGFACQIHFAPPQSVMFDRAAYRVVAPRVSRRASRTRACKAGLALTSRETKPASYQPLSVLRAASAHISMFAVSPAARAAASRARNVS